MVVEAIVDTDNDMINSPSHYLRGKHEVIEVLEAWDLPFHISCAVKYLARNGFKNDEKEEMEKCFWYLKRWQFVLRQRAGISVDFLNVIPVKLTADQEGDGFSIYAILNDWQLANTVVGLILMYIYNGELQLAIDQLSTYIESLD